MTSRVRVQLLAFDLTAAAPDPSTIDLSNAITGVKFEPIAVRVVSSTAASTTLLVGGVDDTNGATYPGIVIIGTVAVGASTFHVTGSVVLPSSNSGVTALSQTSAVVPGYVLASTDLGVFKCVCGV